ncbi:unnamed protein product [Euphydryas editha]|uniref:Uncharacterized protein n=1 Tax=Euphydryas editha TaxID=104508 RepID=A0AAU9UJH9_EUPED|nr:unnamed protein product [Euphydryas editha]
MKTVLLVLTVIAFANTDGVVDKSEDFDSNVIMRQLFEMLKYFIKNGCDENGFPMTDPFEFDYKYYKFYLPNKLLSLQAAFTNGVIFGLSNFNVQHTKFIRDEIAIELCINFPLVTFHSGELHSSIQRLEVIIFGQMQQLWQSLDALRTQINGNSQISYPDRRSISFRYRPNVV